MNLPKHTYCGQISVQCTSNSRSITGGPRRLPGSSRTQQRWSGSYLRPRLPLHTHVEADEQQQSQSWQHSLMWPLKLHDSVTRASTRVLLVADPVGSLQLSECAQKTQSWSLRAPLVNWAGGGAAEGGTGDRAFFFFFLEGGRVQMNRREREREAGGREGREVRRRVCGSHCWQQIGSQRGSSGEYFQCDKYERKEILAGLKRMCKQNRRG